MAARVALGHGGGVVRPPREGLPAMGSPPARSTTGPLPTRCLSSMSTPFALPEPYGLRPATVADTPALLALIHELAAYEQLSHRVQATAERLAAHLFGPQPRAEAVLATHGEQAVAFALFFHTYSTFLARPGLWLEDLYVQPAHRGQGVGRALLRHVAQLAAQRGCGRLEWSVLDWNAPAQAFYRRMGAEVLPDWRICRLTGEALGALGGAAADGASVASGSAA